jgi:hypothetical protein
VFLVCVLLVWSSACPAKQIPIYNEHTVSVGDRYTVTFACIPYERIQHLSVHLWLVSWISLKVGGYSILCYLHCHCTLFGWAHLMPSLGALKSLTRNRAICWIAQKIFSLWQITTFFNHLHMFAVRLWWDSDTYQDAFSMCTVLMVFATQRISMHGYQNPRMPRERNRCNRKDGLIFGYSILYEEQDFKSEYNFWKWFNHYYFDAGL